VAKDRPVDVSISHPIQRRVSPRIKLFCMAHFRRSDAGPTGHARLCAVRDISQDSIYFVAASHELSEAALLLLRFSYNLNSSVKGREYLMEVMRINPLRQGRCGVGARLVPYVPLTLQDGWLKAHAASPDNRWPETASGLIDLYI